MYHKALTVRQTKRLLFNSAETASTLHDMCGTDKVFHHRAEIILTAFCSSATSRDRRSVQESTIKNVMFGILSSLVNVKTISFFIMHHVLQ